MAVREDPVSGIDRPAVPAAIVRGRVIAIARGLDPASLIRIGEGLAAGGIGAFEVTLNSPGALRSIEALAARFGDEELLVGAGTILTVEDARAAIGSGARYIVMPHTDVAVIEHAASRGVPVFPGAFTPTEILAAWRAGATAIKVFPASCVGPSFVRELRGPLPAIPLVPTGGVTLETAPAYIAEGAVAVGLGSWLTGDGDPAGIAERGLRLVAALGAAR
jgi:2-dehydro-3-deoxyphosphogluconate aldolase/(4S)-4-hydroxy-2-oxoglutarate aldolase